MFTQRVAMSQANEIATVEPTPQSALRREPGSSSVVETRGSRVLLRIPDCTARLSTIGREVASWRMKLQTMNELTGSWLDAVRPVAPPRVLAAGAIGILLGLVMILLTPGKKPAPAIHTHSN